MCPPPTRAAPLPPRCYCPQRLSSEGLSASRAQQTFLWSIIFCICPYLSWKVLFANVLLIWFDLQQNRMLVNHNLNSNVGLLVHLREAIWSKSWISFLWNQDGKLLPAREDRYSFGVWADKLGSRKGSNWFYWVCEESLENTDRTPQTSKRETSKLRVLFKTYTFDVFCLFCEVE